APLPFPECILRQSSDPGSLPGSPRFPATPALAARAPQPQQTPRDCSRESLRYSPKAKAASPRTDTKSPAAPAQVQAAMPPPETTARAAPHRETPRASAICSGRLLQPTDGCAPALNRAPRKPPQPPADRPTPKSHQRARQPAPPPTPCKQQPPATRNAQQSPD